MIKQFFMYKFKSEDRVCEIMRRVLQLFFAILLVNFVSSCETAKQTVFQNTISPSEFGLDSAKTDQERYWVLYKTHVEASRARYSRVVYAGIDTIKIEIPENAKTIPLTPETDFCNVVLLVRNNAKNMTLFSMESTVEQCLIDNDIIEKRKKIEGRDEYILIIEDENPWVNNRRGYNYGHKRKDIVYVKDGKVYGSVVSTYSTQSSKPCYAKSFVENLKKSFKNIEFVRDSSCTYKTNLLSLVNQFNVEIAGVKIMTPTSKLYGDAAISLDNCYKVKIVDVSIDGTYSQEDKYGYGITMNNVSDVEILNLIGHAKWGVFGNNNVNNTRLKDCDINRFDVHCYGRDVFFENCNFRNLYNQFSSMYGTVSFKKCEFYDFTPVLFESSYNAYTKFDLVFKNCIVHPDKNRCSLIYGGGLNGDRTTWRKELEVQEFPDLYIDGLKILMPSDVDNYYIYSLKNKKIQWPQDNIPDIKKMQGFKYVQKEYSQSTN